MVDWTGQFASERVEVRLSGQLENKRAECAKRPVHHKTDQPINEQFSDLSYIQFQIRQLFKKQILSKKNLK